MIGARPRIGAPPAPKGCGGPRADPSATSPRSHTRDGWTLVGPSFPEQVVRPRAAGSSQPPGNSHCDRLCNAEVGLESGLGANLPLKQVVALDSIGR